MYIADMHCDSLMNVSSSRGMINEYNFSKKHPQLQFFASFVPCGNDAPPERRKKTMRNLNVYIAERERLSLISAESSRDIIKARQSCARCSLFSIEGGGGLFADSEELDILYKTGLRVLGLAWDKNELSSSAWDSNDEGLSDEGRAMVRICSEMGIILDTSHLSDRAFYELLDITGYPVVATHSNFRDICNSKRNLTLDMARKIAEGGGIIGLNLYPPFLSDSGTADFNDIIRHIDYALEKLGENTLGLGFDIDGTDGIYPKGFCESSSIHDRFAELLLSRYDERIAKKILGENVLNFLENNL